MLERIVNAAVVAIVAALIWANGAEAQTPTAEDTATPEGTSAVLAPMPVETTQAGCWIVDFEGIPEDTPEEQIIGLSAYRDAGWVGSPLDNKDAIYNPECWTDAVEDAPEDDTYAATVIDVTDPPEGSTFNEELIELGWFGVAGDGCECLYSPDPNTYTSPVNFGGLSDSEVVDTVNSLSDAERWTLSATGNLPEAPEGYAYAEDHTIVPLSFWS